MRPLRLILTVALSATTTNALIGYGISMYRPNCAFACGDVVEAAPLSCSVEGHAGGHHGGGSFMTSPECRANDSPYLTTLALCMQERCNEYDVQAWKLEKYWSTKATGDSTVLPKWTYAQSVNAIQTLNGPFDAESVINGTMTVSLDAWNAEKRSLNEFERQETLHSRYGIVVLVAGFATPIFVTAIGYLPYMGGLFDVLRPYIVYPSTIATYHIQPLPYLIGNAPTVGQAIYITFFFILNFVLCSVSYRSVSSTWFDSSYQEILGYVANRTGVLAFALAPLVILFSGRNNILLWCTNWSHSTFMLLHRWVARIFGLQVIIHSIVELMLYGAKGELATEQKEPYWIWGIVGTLAACIMLVASLLYMRRWSYEVFLLIHIVLAILVLVGSWQHVELLFQRKWGYQYWLYAAFAVWIFDRVVRVLRIAKVGVRRANITEIGSHFVRVDVQGVRWSVQSGYHAYAYFPTLQPLTPWENHPFSVIPTAMLRPYDGSVSPGSASTPESASSENGDVEKSGDIEKSGDLISSTRRIQAARSKSTAGVSLYIRKSKGRTGWLKGQTGLVALLDGPYTSNPTKQVLKCDRLLLIAGGIGITGVLPFTHAHLNAKLCWSVKDYARCLVEDLSPALTHLVEKEVRVGRRFDLQTVLAQEADTASETSSRVRVGVVVCGPASMCDDTRAIVARLGREQSSQVVFELEVHAFSW